MQLLSQGKMLVLFVVWISFLMNTGQFMTSSCLICVSATSAASALQQQSTNILLPESLLIPEISTPKWTKDAPGIAMYQRVRKGRQHDEEVNNSSNDEKKKQDPKSFSNAVSTQNVDTMVPSMTPSLIPPSISPAVSQNGVEANADAFIRGGAYRNDNYGSSTTLTVKNDGRKSRNRKAVMKFDLSKIAFPKEPYAVALRLHVLKKMGSDALRIVTALRLANSDWTEGNVTWANLDAVVDQIGSTFIITTSDRDTWVEVDVTDLVENNTGILALMLENMGTSSPSSSCNFGSRQSGLSPKLIVVPADEEAYATTATSLTESNITISGYQDADDLLQADEEELTANSSFTSLENSTSSGNETDILIQKDEEYERPMSTVALNGLSSAAVTATTVAAALVTVATLRFTFYTVPSYLRNRSCIIRKPGDPDISSELQLCDDGTTTVRDYGSDGSSIASMTDDGPNSWFKALTDFQSKGGSGLGGSVHL